MGGTHARAPAPPPRPRDGLDGRRASVADVNTVLRILLVLWIVIYLAIACAPLISSNAGLGVIGFIGGVVLLIPWLFGVAALSFLIWLTRRRI